MTEKLQFFICISNEVANLRAETREQNIIARDEKICKWIISSKNEPT